MAAICEYLHNPGAVQADTAAAFDREHQPHLFDRLPWWRDLHTQCLSDTQFLLALAKDPDGNGLCALPLIKTGLGKARSLANWYNFTYRPVFSGAHGEVAKLALLRTIAQSLPAHAAVVHLEPLPEEDDSVALVERTFSQAGWIVRTEPCDVNHILEVKGRSFDQYWQGRPGQMRSTVRRKSRKNDVSIRIETAFTDEGWADYEAVYARSWKPEEGNPEYLKHLAKAESDAGCLRLGIAYLDGRPVAAQFWTVENGMALIHKLAHDERAIKASPGTLLSAALFQYVIDTDNAKLIDFGTGNDTYKSDWMEAVRTRHRISLYWPKNPLSWPYLAKTQLSALVGRRRTV